MGSVKMKHREKDGYYMVSVKGLYGEFEHHDVPHEVFLYIRQLESYIRHPELSKLKEVYKERFE